MPAVQSPQTELPDMDRPIEFPEELDDPCLPDRVRILRLLEANGGRVWQAQLVDVLDVSKATVSRRLSELEESTHISRMLFRGRNLVWLREEVPDVMEPALT